MTTLAVVGQYGRLGNRLWTTANVIAFARDCRMRVAFPTLDRYQSYFERPSVLDFRHGSIDAHDQGPSRSMRRYSKAIELFYRINLRTRIFPVIEIGEGGLLDLNRSEETLRWLSEHSMVFLSGFYFKAAGSLQRHGDYIRALLAPATGLRAKVEACIAAARSRGEIIVGVHMRYGDYRTFCDGIMFYTPEEYRDVMADIARQLSPRRVAFVICSDEPQDLAQFGDLDVLDGVGTEIGDLYALASCDYIFGPNSTYSHWASFHGKVPLHVLDWKGAQAAGTRHVIKRPTLAQHFAPYAPEMFGLFSRSEIVIDSRGVRPGIPLDTTPTSTPPPA